jgi:hypothetical protein
MNHPTLKARQELAAWAEGKPPLLAAATITVGAASATVRELLAGLDSEDLQQLWGSPKLQRQCERYWLSPEAWAEDFAVAISQGMTAEESAENIRFARSVARWLRTGQPPASFRRNIECQVVKLTPRRLRSSEAYCRRVGKVLLPLYIENLLPLTAPEPLESTGETYNGNQPGLPSLHFLMKVIVPCVAEFGRPPWPMFAGAIHRRRPSQMELLSLLRIDKQVLHHPRVRAVVNDPARQQFWLPKIAKAILSRPRKRTRQEWKYRGARLIRRLFETVDHPITEPEIRDLYDRLARARAEGLIDSDIAEAPEAFARALSRDKGFWQVMPYPDTSIQNTVRELRRFAA